MNLPACWAPVVRSLLWAIWIMAYTPAAHAEGFSGRVVVELLEEIGNEHKFRLLEDFQFLDPRGKRWLAQRGGVVDDECLPPELAALADLPHVADYRKAAFLHTHFARARSETWADVHRMLYDAAIAEGIDELHARGLYAAVRAAGLRWEVRESSCYRSCHASAGQLVWKPAVDVADVETIVSWVLTTFPDLDAIDRHVDAAIKRPGPHLFAQRP